MLCHDGPYLEKPFFPAWDVLPTESDHPEGLTLGGRRLVTDKLREMKNEVAHPLPPEWKKWRKPETRNQKPETVVPRLPRNRGADHRACCMPCKRPMKRRTPSCCARARKHDPILLGRQLAEAGYEATGQVEVRGEFSLRGGILDISPHLPSAGHANLRHALSSADRH